MPNPAKDPEDDALPPMSPADSAAFEAFLKTEVVRRAKNATEYPQAMMTAKEADVLLVAARGKLQRKSA